MNNCQQPAPRRENGRLNSVYRQTLARLPSGRRDRPRARDTGEWIAFLKTAR